VKSRSRQLDGKRPHRMIEKIFTGRDKPSPLAVIAKSPVWLRNSAHLPIGEGVLGGFEASVARLAPVNIRQNSYR